MANDRNVTTNKDTPADITLRASDPDLQDNLKAEIVSQPSDGRLSGINQTSGIVTYTPNPGFTGTDKFTFKVNDGKVDSNKIGVVGISVNQPNHPPVANDRNVTTNKDTPADITLRASDPDLRII